MDAYKSQKPWKIIDTKIKQGILHIIKNFLELIKLI